MVSIRSELLRVLFQSFIDNDTDKFLDIANEIIKDEEKMKHHLLAKDLKKIVNSKNQGQFQINPNFSGKYKTNISIPRDSEKGFPLLEIKEVYYNFDDVILTDELKQKLQNLLEEFAHREILATYGLKPKQKLLFCGPPGTGKTLTSYIISSVLGYPLIHVRFDSIVSSFLGETATNLRKIFDFIEEGEWIILFDEFDIIGKKRDDPYEHGEIKRVVNNFMQMLDGYNGRSLLIAATNHQHLLDSAMWRRFDDILFYDLPNSDLREQLFTKYLRVLKRQKNIDLKLLAELTDGFSAAEVAKVCEEALRRSIILGKSLLSPEDIIHAIEQQNKLREQIQKV